MKTIGIIGGGIAGLALAIDLAKKEYHVTVFEKNKYPNHKVCGEYVSAECDGYLAYLGILEKMQHCPRINHLQVSAPSGRMFSANMKVGGIGISRYQFDDLLYKKALEYGVNFVFEEVVEANKCEITSKSNLKYKYDKVIGSFGKRSNLDVKWERGFTQKTKNRLNQWIGIKYHIQYDGINDKTIALHNFEYGYCGISQVESGTVCLCYLVSSKMMKDKTIVQLEKDVLMKNPHLKHILNHSQSLYAKPLAISQISFDKKDLHHQNLDFIGDAAGLITPLCGNGMSLALRSAKLMALHLTQPNFNYRASWQKEIAPRLFWGRLIQKGFGNVWLTELLVITCRLIPQLGRFLVGKSHGDHF